MAVRKRERFQLQRVKADGWYGECPRCGKWAMAETREEVVEALQGHMARHGE